MSLIYGVHAVQALLQNPNRKIQHLYINDDRHDERFVKIRTLAQLAQVPIENLTMVDINQRFKDILHQGVVALADALPQYSERDIPLLLAKINTMPLILILDGVTDPHNLGACLRSADAAGVHFVIIPKDKNAQLSPVVTKVACGATESIPLISVTNLVRTIELLKQQNIWIYGAAGEAETSIYQLDAKHPLAIVMGAEGSGLRRLTRVHCDALFSLPMLGQVSSLNVSVATGVCLYEIMRQRKDY